MSVILTPSSLWTCLFHPDALLLDGVLKWNHLLLLRMAAHERTLCENYLIENLQMPW
ncbi:hypothetical protein AMELA_G00148260 [Ameiurus melas]|uniref:Uncharacterized protein n=1 Tax=Ameiurus melas TaxID=219545 RepID=A0A7J6AGW2_AMEME|nr:hypothetical protein AMELA_G00148260 [Ameiurus melas]